MMRTNERGFSLIEILLSVSIITMLVGLSLPVYQTFQNRNDLDVSTQSVADALRRAQTYARGVNRDSTWGVSILPTGATLFKGATYATRDASYDEKTTFPTGMTVSGVSEVVFSKLSAAPSTTNPITLTSTNGKDTRTITLNAKGTVSY